MGIAIPQVIAEDRASGAQIIDGSLKFEGSKATRLDFANSGSSTTFTASMWVKRHSLGGYQHFFFSSDTSNGCGIGFDPNNKITLHSNSAHNLTDRVFRDTSSWYHLVLKVTSGTADLYVNNELAKSGVSGFELSSNARIGDYTGGAYPANISMSQVYVIDGQALGPEEFGFTDPFTNTWRPKKFEGPTSPNDGTTWSSNLTVSGGTYVIQNPGYAFDNDSYGTYADASGSGDAVYTFSPTSTIRANSSFRVSAYAANGQDTNHIKITYNNGVEVTKTANDLGLGTPGDQVWFDLSSYINFPADISSIEYKSIGGGGRLAAIEIDGILLIDGLNDPKGFGTNGFYLPMDGNSSIGQDKSDRGNNWTPVNFGGSNSLEKATGALPILNTVGGGKVATVGVRTDATVAAGVGTCVLAVPMAGPMPGNYNDVSNQIDSRSSVKTVTADDNADFSTDTSIFYSGSFKFDGTSDKVSIVDHDELDGFGDFTIEMWWYCSTLGSGEYLLAKGNSYMPYMIYNSGSDVLEFFASSDGQPTTGWDISNGASFGSSIPMLNKWNHIAVTREGSTGRLFLNGVQTDTFTSSLPLMTNGDNVTVFADSTGGAAPIGYAQDLRIYNGVAKYTSNFIPASTSPDILPDTPSGVSGSSKLAKIANGSVGFAGTSRLSIGSNDDIGLYSDNFTIEGFFNKITTTGNQTLLASQNYYTAGYSGNWVLRITDNANIAFSSYDGQSNQEISEFAAPNGVNRWHHFALVREGTGSTQTKFYFDGKFAGSMTLSKSLSDSGSHGIFIGHDDGYNNDLDGFISNVRIVKGTAVYTSNFTPPTEPLTNITNTKLLCAQSASEHKDITGRLYKSGALYTTKADIIANATPLEGGETLNGDYLYYVPSGNELIRQQIFSVNGGITNGDSSNSWSWMRHNGTNWLAISGGYTPSQFIQFYFDADDTSYQLDPSRDFYALTLLGGTSPSHHRGTAPTLRKQFVLDAAVIPSSTNPVIHQLYEPTVLNFNPFDTDINTVRGQETDHCTLNPLSSNNTNITLSEGNLYFEKTSTAGAWGVVYGTIGMTTGKWYWEAEIISADENIAVGVSTPDITIIGGNGQYFNGEFSVKVGYVIANDGDHWGFAIDMDNRTVQLYKNGIEYQTNTGTGTYAVIPNIIPDTVETLFPCVTGYGQYQTSPASRARVNFGQKPFKFSPPDGFQPLNDTNAKPETVITRPDQYVGVTTYSGNVSSGTGTQQIKVGTQPDLVWIKKTSGTNAQHRLVDSVRGPNEELYSDTDQDSGSNNGLNSFDSDGFTVWTSNAGYNELGQDYVAWTWKAGGNKTTFNVDDVGYANASDVNMNAGALNSTIYDQSEVWSTNSTMTLATGAFDGTTEGSSGNANYSSSGNILTSSSITINNKLEIYTNRTHTGATEGTKITINGTDYYDRPLASTGWSEVVIPRETLPLTSTGNITITDTQGTSGLWSVRVDGKRLVDSNATPPNLPAISATGCSIGTKQGFSIVKYTGSGTDNDAVPHGLLQKPDFVIVKNITTSSTDWRVWSSAYGDNRNLRLNKIGDRNSWNEGNIYGHTSSDTAITLSCAPSTNLSDDVNLSGNEYIMYSWHNVPGLQKFGSYLGNGVADGTYIELGFRPALVIVKLATIASGSANWFIYDSKMEKYNEINKHLIANSPGNMGTGYPIDFLSNGFKLRYADTGGYTNLDNSLFIYAAWAEAPSVNLYGGQSNAR